MLLTRCASLVAPRAARGALRRAASAVEDGYALNPNADGVGGWLAHRSDVGVAGGPAATGSRRSSAAPARRRSSTRALRCPGAEMDHKPRVLVLHGSLRERSFSRLLAFETARLLEAMGCDVRCYDPTGLPVRDPTIEDHPKVVELRALSEWSEGHVWSSPEMHGCITGAFKNQIDWLPLNTGSVRPTQGRTCVVMQVNGGSQSFNAVNELRRLARWMRMPCCTNQSSVAKAWQEFDDDGRMKPSGFRDRVVDVAEEYVKFTKIMREYADDLNDRYSERYETAEKGRLLTQAEKEAAKEKEKMRSK
ncbi:NADPH-dependent FMN reductase [Aureococcus anophagefferens]|nr:NADPH-dependent FMN reductase [Aureococcus anophagefferens]